VKVGDAVRHKTKGTVGVVHEIAKHGAQIVGLVKLPHGIAVLVNWTDKSGVMFRWARAEDLEVISESR